MISGKNVASKPLKCYVKYVAEKLSVKIKVWRGTGKNLKKLVLSLIFNNVLMKIRFVKAYALRSGAKAENCQVAFNS